MWHLYFLPIFTLIMANYFWSFIGNIGNIGNKGNVSIHIDYRYIVQYYLLIRHNCLSLFNSSDDIIVLF